jgi:hypothetical protein
MDRLCLQVEEMHLDIVLAAPSGTIPTRQPVTQISQNSRIAPSLHTEGNAPMTKLVLKLWNEEAGFVVSAELILISTIAVLAMIVGLSEVAYGVTQELEDTASAFGAINQSYRYTGLTGHAGISGGSSFGDLVDFCDAAGDVVGTLPTGEGWNHN